jgi:hypothetical protein
MYAMRFCRQLTSKNDLLTPNRKLVWDRWYSFKTLSKSPIFLEEKMKRARWDLNPALGEDVTRISLF